MTHCGGSDIPELPQNRTMTSSSSPANLLPKTQPSKPISVVKNRFKGSTHSKILTQLNTASSKPTVNLSTNAKQNTKLSFGTRNISVFSGVYTNDLSESGLLGNQFGINLGSNYEVWNIWRGIGVIVTGEAYFGQISKSSNVVAAEAFDLRFDDVEDFGNIGGAIAITPFYSLNRYVAIFTGATYQYQQIFSQGEGLANFSGLGFTSGFNVYFWRSVFISIGYSFIDYNLSTLTVGGITRSLLSPANFNVHTIAVKLGYQI